MKTAGTRRIAERYVTALFDVASDQDALVKVERDMLAIRAALETSSELREFLANPLLSRAEQAQALAALLKEMKADKVTQRFAEMLAHQKRLPVLPEIAALFIERAAAARGELQAQVISATKLGKKELERISERLSSTYGKVVQLEVKQAPELLGGIMINIGSHQIDGSLAGKMDRLKQALRTA